MKRLLISLTALLLLAGCSNNVVSYTKMDAKEQYQYATEKFITVNSFTSSATMDMNMSIDGESMPVSSVMEIKTVNSHDPKTIEMEIKQTIEGINQVMYFNDDFMYVSILDQKIKMSTGLEDMEEIAANTQVSKYDDSMMDNFTSEVKDDEVIISFDLNENYLNDMIAQLLGTDGDIADLDIFIHSSSGTLITDLEGNLKQNLVSMDMETVAEGISLRMTMTMDLSYRDINNTSIDFPNDLNSYTLVE